LGGTYFPKEAKYGRSSFVSVLKTVAETFRGDPGRIKKNTEIIGRELSKPAPSGGDGGLSLAHLDDLAPKIVPIIDPLPAVLTAPRNFRIRPFSNCSGGRARGWGESLIAISSN